MKKILAVVLALIMILTVSAMASADEETYLVGICQLVPHEALDAATQGFKDALEEVSCLTCTTIWRRYSARPV